MSQIAITARLVTSICAVLLIVTGCGTPNEKSSFDPVNQKHAADWMYAGHAGAAQAQVKGCTECHGGNLLGGISRVSCRECHPNGPSPMTGCTSCHGNPPTGSAAPNRNGAHTAHYGFANGANPCNTCHIGAGSGTPSHYNGAVDVGGLSAFSAMSGTAVRNADGTCSKVSCHGGQTTPAWLSGVTIDVDTQCIACHAFGTTEYNSYNSGQHDFHVNTRQWQNECWRCHDVTLLGNVHFASLSTTTLDGQAYLTLHSYVGYNKSTGKCLALCHSAYSRGW